MTSNNDEILLFREAYLHSYHGERRFIFSVQLSDDFLNSWFLESGYSQKQIEGFNMKEYKKVRECFEMAMLIGLPPGKNLYFDKRPLSERGAGIAFEVRDDAIPGLCDHLAQLWKAAGQDVQCDAGSKTETIVDLEKHPYLETFDTLRNHLTEIVKKRFLEMKEKPKGWALIPKKVCGPDQGLY